MKDKIDAQKLNIEERDLLVTSLSEENKILQGKLEKLENAKIYQNVSKTNSEVITNPEIDINLINFYEELNLSLENKGFVEKFVCKSCGNNFVNLQILNKHSNGCHKKCQLEQYASDLRKQVSYLRKYVTKRIF